MWIAILVAIAIICFSAGALPKNGVPDDTAMDGHDPCDPDMD